MKNPQKLTKKQCMQDLYKVVGVSKFSTIPQIKAAYLDKKNSYEDAESLQHLKVAFAILTNPELRAEYDAFRDMGGMSWSIRRGNDIMNRGVVVAGSFGG